MSMRSVMWDDDADYIRSQRQRPTLQTGWTLNFNGRRFFDFRLRVFVEFYVNPAMPTHIFRTLSFGTALGMWAAYIRFPVDTCYKFTFRLGINFNRGCPTKSILSAMTLKYSGHLWLAWRVYCMCAGRRCARNKWKNASRKKSGAWGVDDGIEYILYIETAVCRAYCFRHFPATIDQRHLFACFFYVCCFIRFFRLYFQIVCTATQHI